MNMLSSSRPRLPDFLPPHAFLSRRSLWWWSHKPHKFLFTESDQSEMRRQHRLMMYRYAKSVRRRATWERDSAQDGAESFWGWHRPRWAKRLCVDRDHISSKHGPDSDSKGYAEPNEAGYQERGTAEQPKSSSRTFEDNFEEMKRRIEADPYAAIFGRHLEHTLPTSSFLKWFLEPEGRSGNHAERSSLLNTQSKTRVDVSSNGSSTAADRSSSNTHVTKVDSEGLTKVTKVTRSRTPQTTVVTTEEYEYDPISMRKVPKQGIPPLPRSTDDIDGSHGKTDVPMKRFVQDEKVMNHGSRSDEVSFGEKNICSSEEIENPVSSASDDIPLFSGTAYENSSRVRSLTNTSGQKSSPESKLVPALDRMQSPDSAGTNSVDSQVPFERRVVLEKDYNARGPEDSEFLSSRKARKNEDRTFQTQTNISSTAPSVTIPGVIAEMKPNTPENAPTKKADQPDVTTQNLTPSRSRMAVPETIPMEVRKAQDEARARTLQMQHASAAAHEAERALKFRDMKVATTMKALYEEQYGKITPSHRQQNFQQPVRKQSADFDVRELTPSDQNAEAVMEIKEPGHLHNLAALTSSKNYGTKQGEYSSQAHQDNVVNLEDRRHTSSPDVVISRKPGSEISPVPVLDGLETRLSELQAVTRDLSHILSTMSSAPPTAQIAKEMSSPDSYKVLAFDPVTLRVNVAKMTSRQECHDRPRPASELLSQLHNAAKFLPHFSSLHNQGYELVSGSRNTLVFKRVPTSADLSGSGAEEDIGSEEISKHLREGSRSERSRAKSLRSGPKIRRQEEVFSGSRHKRNHEPLGPTEVVLETWKRILLGGALTAAFCYLVGAATEMVQGKVEAPKTHRRPGMYSTDDAR